MPILAVFLLLFILLPLLRHSKKTGLTDAQRAVDTQDALNLIESGERLYRSANGRYTSHLADLLVKSPGLAQDLAVGVGVELDVSSDGKAYYARVESTVLSLVRTPSGKVSCLSFKSRIKCASPTATTPTTTPTTPTKT